MPEIDEHLNKKNLILLLETISEKLGDVYVSMAESYPVIFRTLDDKIDLLQLKGSDSNSTFCGLHTMENVLNFLKNTVQSEGSILSELAGKDSLFLDKLEEELSRSRTYARNIEQIEDDSAELELISLNAMVTALKAGKNGGAFPYITEELQKVSRESAAVSVLMKKNGAVMDRIFHEFLEKIQKEKKELNSATTQMDATIAQMLDIHLDYRDQLETFGDHLITGVGRIKSPLYKILQEVQKHDIIRQSIEHIIYSLKEPVDGGSTVEKQLDSLSFQKRIYQMSYEILFDLLEDLHNTHELFQTKSADFSSFYETIENVGRDFHIKNDDDSYTMKILEYEESLFRNSSVIRKGYTRKYLKNSFDLIIKEINALVESSERYIGIISHIKTINISSRVEAAKLPDLLNMGILIDNISERTESLERNVEEIVSTIKEFKNKTDQLFTTFFRDFKADEGSLDIFISDLKKGLEELKESHIYVDKCTSDVILLGDRYNEFYEKSMKDLLSMGRLKDQLEQVMVQTEKGVQHYASEFERVLSDSPYDKWELSSDAIEKLTAKFTIFKHKKSADRENTLNMSHEGAESGEITLF